VRDVHGDCVRAFAHAEHTTDEVHGLLDAVTALAR